MADPATAASGCVFCDILSSVVPDYVQLTRGYSIKVHFGSFETIEHAKLRIVNVE